MKFSEINLSNYDPSTSIEVSDEYCANNEILFAIIHVQARLGESAKGEQRVVLHGSKLVDEAEIASDAICQTDGWISTALRRINSYIIPEQGSTHSQLITLTARSPPSGSALRF